MAEETKYIKGYFIDPIKKEHGLKVVTDELESYYKLLHCSTIEAPEICIDGKYFDAICDEDYSLTHPSSNYGPPSVIDENWQKNEFMIFGPVFLVHANEDGDWISLDDDDWDMIESHIKYGVSDNSPALFIDCFGDPDAIGD